MNRRRRSSTSRHLSLMGQSDESLEKERALRHLEEIKVAPLFSSRVRNAIQPSFLPQYGFLGVQRSNSFDSEEGAKTREGRFERDNLIYANMNAPWSAFICGSQGGGKSHTLSCLLENSLLGTSDAGVLPNPLTGIVFHYDKFTSHSATQLCEAAYICSSGIPVRVLVSPTNIWAMERLYTNLPGLPAGAPRPQVLPLRFRERQLNCSNLRTLMAVKDGAQLPLYLAVLNQLLRDIAMERAGRPGIDYPSFKARLGQQGFTEAQSVPLNMRLQLLESFLDLNPALSREQSAASSDIWQFEKGSLTIVDLSCPFVNEDEACALFSICLGLFLEGRTKDGRVVALDEAHKFLTKSGEAEVFTDQLLSIIRQQRHLATRVLIATQEPTLSPSLIDLCNVTIIHRFLSPAWFEVLKNHLAGARSKSTNTQDDLFRKIVQLRTGDALLFSPTSVLDLSWTQDDEPMLMPVTLDSSFINLRIRNRVTADGGKSIMASDKMQSSPSSSDGEPNVDKIATALGRTIISAAVTSDGSNSSSSSRSNSIVPKYRTPAFPQAKKVATEPRGRDLPAPSPRINSNLALNSESISALHTVPVSKVAATVQTQVGLPLSGGCQKALKAAVSKLYRQDSTQIDFGKARMAATEILSLPRNYFEDYWLKEASKEVLKSEVELLVRRSGRPPPRNATWMRRHK